MVIIGVTNYTNAPLAAVIKVKCAVILKMENALKKRNAVHTDKNGVITHNNALNIAVEQRNHGVK